MATKKKMQKGGVTWTDNGQGVTKTKDTRKGGTKDKSFTTVNGYAGSSSRVTNTKRDAEGTVLKEKTKSISPKRVERVENRTESKMTYKTGGMVNANAKISAAKTATGSVGGVTKAVSKVAVKSTSPKGRVGGISKAPKKALPKAQMGAVVKTPPTPGGTPKAGGAILKDTSNKRIPKAFINSGKPKAGGAILKDTSKAKMGGSKGKC